MFNISKIIQSFIFYFILSSLLLTASEETQTRTNQSPAPQIQATFLHPCLKNHPDYEEYFVIYPAYPKTHLTFTNFPINQPLGYYLKRNLPPLDRDYELKNCFTILPDGRFEGINYRAEHMVVDAVGFLPGERINIKLLGVNPLFKHEISMIPYRLIADNGLFSVEAEILALVPATVYVIAIEGLDEGENVLITSTSDGEVIEFPLTCSSTHKMIHLPGVEGKKGGINTFKITRNDGTSATLTLPWGLEFVQYIK